MAYEIDFIGVGVDKVTHDADAICLRWKYGIDSDGNPQYKVGVIDGGFEAHGIAMSNHMNQYYFDDDDGKNPGVFYLLNEMTRVIKDSSKAFIGTPNVCSLNSLRYLLLNSHPFMYLLHYREYTKYELGQIIRARFRKKIRHT